MAALEPPLEHLLETQPIWRGAAARRVSAVISSGYEMLDQALGGGWPGGMLTEILGARDGTGELQLLLPALAALTMAGKRVVWLAPPHLPYAPALAAAGLDLANLAVVRAPGRRDALWAAEQALRAGSCHALLGWFRHARYAELRRLAVAAESGCAFVAVFRPQQAAAESSPAALRISLQGMASELEIRILKRRGMPLAMPLRLPVKRPVHALGRSALFLPSGRDAREHRVLGLPVHA